MIKNPKEIGRVRDFCENKSTLPLFSNEKCLALFLSLDLSKQQYIELRKTLLKTVQISGSLIIQYNMQNQNVIRRKIK